MHDVGSAEQRELEAENTNEESDRRWRQIYGEPSNEQQNEPLEEESEMHVGGDRQMVKPAASTNTKPAASTKMKH
jgi:hypothetical protein